MDAPTRIPRGRSSAGPTRSPQPREDDAIVEPGAIGARAVLLPVAVVLAIGLVFVSVFLAAFHAPTPHRLPVAIVGSAQTAALSTRLDRALPGNFEVRSYRDEAGARQALEHRQVYAAYLTSSHGARLLTASANGPAVTSLLTVAFSAEAKAGGKPLAQQDVVPAAAGDTRGLSIFYAAFGLVLAGFLFGTLTYQVAARLELRQRLISLMTFGVAGGALVTLVAQAFDAISGPPVAIAAVFALMAIAAGGASMTFVRLLGGAGVSLGSVVLLVLGNATSGGSLPRAFLPDWLHPLSEVLPVGVAVRAVNGLAYFDGDGLEAALAVLGVWIATCVAALWVRDVVEAAPSRASAPPLPRQILTTTKEITAS